MVLPAMMTMPQDRGRCAASHVVFIRRRYGVRQQVICHADMPRARAARHAERSMAFTRHMLMSLVARADYMKRSRYYHARHDAVLPDARRYARARGRHDTPRLIQRRATRVVARRLRAAREDSEQKKKARALFMMMFAARERAALRDAAIRCGARSSTIASRLCAASRLRVSAVGYLRETLEDNIIFRTGITTITNYYY